MKNILVTGSDGFIGTHLVSLLKSKKCGIMEVRRKSNNSHRNYIVQDIRKISPSDIHKPITTIVHLAALSNIEYCENNPLECMQSNLIGTNRMLEIARKKDARFIFLSSSHVFGNPENLPIKETDRKQALSIYSMSKISGELLCETYAKNYGMNVTIVRPFSVYGPNSPQHNVIAKIISQLMTNSKIILGNIKTKRDFIFINDIINALIMIINSNKKGYIDYNVGTGKSTSIKSICEELARISNKKIHIVSKNQKFRKNDVIEMYCDNSKLRDNYGWKPLTSLHDGLKLTYQHYLKTFKI